MHLFLNEQISSIRAYKKGNGNIAKFRSCWLVRMTCEFSLMPLCEDTDCMFILGL